MLHILWMVQMCGHKIGAVGHIISEVMQENYAPPMTFHSIIHQQIHRSKVLR
jgi:hypothetical protein